MIESCPKCNSSKVKPSASYKDMWFCKDCGAGDYISGSNQNSQGELTIKLMAYDKGNSPLQSLVSNSSKKTLIITEDKRCALGVRIFENGHRDGISRKDSEYQKIANNPSGLYWFLSQPIEVRESIRLINCDYKELAFDRVIIDGIDKRDKADALRMLQNNYIFHNHDNNLKSLEVIILEEKRYSKYPI